jgi:hypothetical protein
VPAIGQSSYAVAKAGAIGLKLVIARDLSCRDLGQNLRVGNDADPNDGVG